ncbi:unnamed protein product [Larinioides sclopetarius]|uniref:Saccharopine dehydrogenase NADP binding domain-containing protein n=1 Tax=Larinioides sclopetarius TaxID=280406 RepID=A0AAV2A9A5_9ARAC
MNNGTLYTASRNCLPTSTQICEVRKALIEVLEIQEYGYTGRYVIEELAHSTKSTNIKWAIAGRNVEKLKESLNIVQGYLGDELDISKTTIIKADVNDASSISDMCKRAQLILNVVGPFLESTQANYFKAAREKGVYIVEACGFDSIPADCGISFLKKKFPGDLNSVEYFVEIGQGPSGRSTNIGTFLSAVHSVRDMFKSKELDVALKEEVFKKDLVKSNYPLSKRFPPLFYCDEVKGWCFWFVGPDERVLKRSQKFRYEYLNDRPVQSNGYIRMHSFFIALCYAFFVSLFGFMSLFSCGRYLLSKVLEGTTKIILYGKGWKDKLPEPTDKHTTEPDTQMKLTITGPEPAYPFTAMCMVQAGLTIIEDTDKLPLEGGVLTPGVAFENTRLVERLEKRGMSFKLESIN